MTTINVTAMEPGHYGVQVEEGDTITSHRVRVPDALLDELDLTDADPERVVHESIGFLLEREQATSILTEFALDDIARFFPEYYDELKARMSS